MAVTISIQEKAFEHEGRKTPVLNDIELSIASGEFLTVIEAERMRQKHAFKIDCRS